MLFMIGKCLSIIIGVIIFIALMIVVFDDTLL